MDFLLDALTNWLKEMLVGGIMGNLSGMFDSVNQQVADIATQVGQTPQGWNGSIFSMIQNLSNSIMVPIAGVILAIVMTLELIQMITDRNNLHDVDTWMIFKWVFKSAAAILIVTNTWNIVMGVFDMAQSVVAQAAGIEAAVREHFDGMYLSHDAAKGVIETYGMDRVMLVLANTVQLQDWDGRYSPRNKEWAKTIPNYNSDTVRCGYALNSHPAVLNGFIDLVREEHLRRQPLTAEDIQAEAERILRELRAPDMPNSPHGTHYMARISPEFLNRAGSKDHDRLMNLLPFRSLSFTGMKGPPGTYATILGSEDRSKELRQPRPSVREHLKQEPKQAAPKAPGHKKREPER